MPRNTYNRVGSCTSLPARKGMRTNHNHTKHHHAIQQTSLLHTNLDLRFRPHRDYTLALQGLQTCPTHMRGNGLENVNALTHTHTHTYTRTLSPLLRSQSQSKLTFIPILTLPPTPQATITTLLPSHSHLHSPCTRPSKTPKTTEKDDQTQAKLTPNGAKKGETNWLHNNGSRVRAQPTEVLSTVSHPYLYPQQGVTCLFKTFHSLNKFDHAFFK
jgi:hypothetical protein